LDPFDFLTPNPVENQFGHPPSAFVGGDIRAVLVEAPVQELEGVAGLMHLVQGIDEVLSGHIVCEQVQK